MIILKLLKYPILVIGFIVAIIGFVILSIAGLIVLDKQDFSIYNGEFQDILLDSLGKLVEPETWKL